MKTALISAIQVALATFLFLSNPEGLDSSAFASTINHSGVIQVQNPTAYPDPAQTTTPLPTYTPYPAIGGDEQVILPTNTATPEVDTPIPDTSTTPHAEITSDPVAYPDPDNLTTVQPLVTGIDSVDQSELTVEIPEEEIEALIDSTPESPHSSTDDSRVYFYLELIFLVFGGAALLLGFAMIYRYFRTK